MARGFTSALKEAPARGIENRARGTAPKPEFADDCREARRERRNVRRRKRVLGLSHRETGSGFRLPLRHRNRPLELTRPYPRRAGIAAPIRAKRRRPARLVNEGIHLANR